MIRKFEKNDINPVMQIWKNENIKAHKFISKEYWKNNYNYVKEILPNAEIYVYVLKENIVGFIGINENYIEGIFIDTKSNEKVNTLKEIFWAMNEVTFTKDVESYQETIIHLTWTEHKTVTHTKLHININHKTANEMVEQYNFNQE